MKLKNKKLPIVLPALLLGLALTACQSIIDNFNSFAGISSNSETSYSSESSSENNSKDSSSDSSSESSNNASSESSNSSSSSSESSSNHASSSNDQSSSNDRGEQESINRPTDSRGGNDSINRPIGVTNSSSKSSSSSSKDDSSSIEQENTAYTTATVQYTMKDLQKKSLYQLSSCPTKGDVNLLVIPVWFKDSATKTGISVAQRGTLKEDIRKAFFGTNEETGWYSLKTYYEEESKINGESQLHISGVVSDWYDTNENASTYGTRSDNTVSLVARTTNWYFDNHPEVNRKDYDSDGDGYLDGVLLLYAYPDYRSDGSNYSNFWAYCYWVQGDANKLVPVPNAFFWGSYDFIYTRRYKLGKYAGGCSNSSPITIDAHTVIHEMGHVFGLDDLYDYSGQYSAAGRFSMQDENVGGHDPFSLLSLGWVNPIVPTDSCTIEIKPFVDSHDLILLKNNWLDKRSSFDEYILLEYYTPNGVNSNDTLYMYQNGYSQGSRQSGIRIWHIDARLLNVTKVYSDYSPFYDSKSLTNDLKAQTVYGFTIAFSNTYYRSSSDSSYNYITALGQSFADYNLVQLIRNNTSTTYRPKDAFNDYSLFYAGSSFDLTTYSKQFVKGRALNSGESLGFSVKVDSITSKQAKISITKN